jgi:hypothetical protein
VSEELLPFARSLPEFAGAYIDQTTGGSLVVMVTGRLSEVTADLRQLEPEANLGVRVVPAQTSYGALRKAVTSAWDVWDRIVATGGLLAVGIDVPSNTLRLEVEPAVLPGMATYAAAMGTALDVQVSVVVGAIGIPAVQTCSTRHRCYNPSETGTFIAQNRPGGTIGFCAMGFHISIGTNEQFLSSGHCGYPAQNYWYQLDGPGWGNEAGTRFAPYGDDVMKVEFSDAQASDGIYGASPSVHVGGYRAPVYGEAVCASLPKQTGPVLDCGTVSDDFKSYSISGAWGTWIVYGGDSSGILVQQGDSGAPVFVLLGTQAVAIGVESMTGQEFALLSEFMPGWGAREY